MEVTAIIAAAGSGRRMGQAGNKVFLPLAGRPVLAHSARKLAESPAVTGLVVVAAAGEEPAVKELLAAARLDKPWQVVTGGSERQQSVANALAVVPETCELVVVHDGARPLVSAEVIEAVIARAAAEGAAVAAVPVKDTIKMVDSEGRVTATPDRSTLWSIQTPQAFRKALLLEAYALAAKERVIATDDAALVERLGVAVRVVLSQYNNLKITTPEDMPAARALLGKGAESLQRMGFGYDVHRLVPDRKLVLGGVDITHDLGLEGHSDADVLLHAIKDALLGAAALGDIGRHFPDTDPRYKGASSLALLKTVCGLLAEQSWQAYNIDATIAAERPKLAPYIRLMNENIATALGIAVNQVNVKATTTEGLGFVGRKEGIAAYAVVSIVRAE